MVDKPGNFSVKQMVEPVAHLAGSDREAIVAPLQESEAAVPEVAGCLQSSRTPLRYKQA